jgi:aminomethyltransferase
VTTTLEKEDQENRKTPLYDRHIQAGARVIPFAGWLMPVQYSGIIQEHRAVRERAGMFDLGHMGQVEVTGPDALSFLQYATTNDVALIDVGKAQYGLIPHESGGVIDDIIIYRRLDGDGYMVVVNASNRDKDVAWLKQIRERRTDLKVQVDDRSDEIGMIAIQGPLAQEITQRLTQTDLNSIDNFSWDTGEISNVQCMVARTGYTGEDGFEFYCSIDHIRDLWDALIDAGSDDGLVPVGLGARDTLRLEARMPLYGNEMDDSVSPLEAGLGWAVKLDKGDFIGRDAMAKMKKKGVPRRTVGFKMIGRSGAPRSHYDVEVDGSTVGHVTSGAFSPSLKENIGLALIERQYAGVDKPLQIAIRGKPTEAVQVKLPFYRRTT